MILRIILKKIFIKYMPIKKNRIVFTSFDGHYSDNPKYISEAIHDMYPNLELVWLLEKKYFEYAPDYVIKAENNTLMSYFYEGSAHIRIDNVYGNRATELYETNYKRKVKYKIFSFLNKKNKQILYTTWHGTPLKKMGRDQINNGITDFSCPNTTMILGNKYTLDIMDRIAFGKIRMQLIGTPRNDILIDNSEKKLYTLKNKLHLPLDKKIVLFAPTFRSNYEKGNDLNIEKSGINQLNELAIDKLLLTLTNKFHGEWVIVCRFHYHVDRKVNWDKLNRVYNGSIINGNQYDDMSEYLYCSDALLTDASSCMFDYLHTKRPCFLYFPDVKEYEMKERGFYTSINNLPFSLSKDFSQLLNSIESFDQLSYSKLINKFQEKLGSIDSSESSKKIAHFIISENF